MFALVALICFILDVFKVQVDVDLIALGLAFISLHLLLGAWPFGGAAPWVRQQP